MLKVIVNETESEYRDRILDIISKNKYSEKTLREFKKDVELYNYLINNIFPLLQRADIQIGYYEPKKSDDQILYCIENDRASLNLKELLYASELSDDINIKKALLEEMPGIDKDDWKPYNNLACISLEQNDNSKAMALLNNANTRLRDNPIILNNMGVASLRFNDPEKALKYFEMTQKFGADVDYNIGMAYLMAGQYSEAKLMLSKFSCRYNTYLSFFSLREYEKVLQLQDCDELSADDYYLMALAYARLKDSGQMLQNLSSAIALDPDMRVKALSDPEFTEYKDIEDFRQLLN